MYKHEGIYLKHQKEKLTHAQYLKAMIKLVNPSALEKTTYVKEVMLPKPKRPYSPRPNARKPHQQHELKLQKDIVHYLRLHNCHAGRIKIKGSWFQGRYLKDKTLMLGVPDIICFTPKGQMYFIEVKYGSGSLRAEQELFKIHCIGTESYA